MSSRAVCHSPRHRRRSSRRRRRKGCASHRHRKSSCASRYRRRSSCKRHRRGSRRRSSRRSKCYRKGPIIRNAFLNYLRRFRKKHCNWHVTKIAVEGAKCWCKTSSREKEKYYAGACKSKCSSCRSRPHRRSGSRRKLHRRSSRRMKRHGRRGGRRSRRMSK
nr:unnamed protein product [Callosobruchus chinensis]